WAIILQLFVFVDGRWWLWRRRSVRLTRLVELGIGKSEQRSGVSSRGGDRLLLCRRSGSPPCTTNPRCHASQSGSGHGGSPWPCRACRLGAFRRGTRTEESAAGRECCCLAAMTDRFHTSGNRSALYHPLEDRWNIHGYHEDHDRNAGDCEGGYELLAGGRRRLRQA